MYMVIEATDVGKNIRVTQVSFLLLFLCMFSRCF